MESLETSAKTVEEAIAKALRQLGLGRSQVDVEVVSQGRPGILGFGAEPARVIVRPRVADGPTTTTARGRTAVPVQRDEVAGPPAAAGLEPDIDEDEDDLAPAAEPLSREEAVAVAVEIVEDILDILDIDAEVSSRPPVTPGDGVGMVAAVIDVTGDDLGLLIGRRGETLLAFQYVVNLMLQRRARKRVMVGIDVGGYRRRREESLRNLANRVADRVRATGQSVTLEPMPPAERRIVHLALADSPYVMTVSIGEGEGRKVAITPRR